SQLSRWAPSQPCCSPRVTATVLAALTSRDEAEPRFSTSRPAFSACVTASTVRAGPTQSSELPCRAGRKPAGMLALDPEPGGEGACAVLSANARAEVTNRCALNRPTQIIDPTRSSPGRAPGN